MIENLLSFCVDIGTCRVRRQDIWRKMNKKQFAVAEGGFMKCKKPTLWVREGNTLTKSATFVNQGAMDLFLKTLDENFQGKITKQPLSETYQGANEKI